MAWSYGEAIESGGQTGRWKLLALRAAAPRRAGGSVVLKVAPTTHHPPDRDVLNALAPFNVVFMRCLD